MINLRCWLGVVINLKTVPASAMGIARLDSGLKCRPNAVTSFATFSGVRLFRTIIIVSNF